MPVADNTLYFLPMGTAIAPLAMELRHNDEALGRVYAGAIDIHDDEEVAGAQVRFWMGLRAFRSRITLRRSLLPRPRADVILLVVR